MNKICIITRLSRQNTNIQKMYQSIENQFDNFYWLIYIQPNTIKIPEDLKLISKNDNRVIVNTSIKRKQFVDSQYSQAIDYGFNSQYAKQSEWLYVLDDDNILHENLHNILNNDLSNIDMIINRIFDKRNINAINNPQNLSEHYCEGHVNWANVVFSSKFFQNKIHHVAIKSWGGDGETIKLFLINGANVYYSNQIAGYYNYLTIISNVHVMRDHNGVESLNKLLNDFFYNQQDLVMAEIGSFAGESASIFINSNHFKTLYCIDPWKLGYDERDAASFQVIDAERIFDEKFKNEPRIIKIKKMSNEAYKDIPDESLDFIYIDGCHQYENVLEDLTNFYPKIKKGGFISGHDWHQNWSGVIQAVREYFKREPITVYQDNSWIYRK